MTALPDLIAYRDALRAARYSGNRRVRTGNTEIEFKTDAEMQAALDALDLDIRKATAATNPGFVYFTTSKGY